MKVNMLNIVWPIFIIISFSFAIFSGNLERLNSSIFESTADAVNLCINLLGTICLWNGIMQIANKTSIINKLSKFLNPIIKFLFPSNFKNNSYIIYSILNLFNLRNFKFISINNIIDIIP